MPNLKNDNPTMTRHKTLLAVLAAAGTMAWGAVQDAPGTLVILHTNDTHSQIDPRDDNGLGGVLRRKAVIDSVRAARPNVMLVDAGDAVQGTLFFTLYGGEVENRVMDSLGYDLRILGNHEFDNGAGQLAKRIAGTRAQWISTNYDMRGMALDSVFAAYAVRDVGGRRIGFMGINLDPRGMVAEGNYDGVRYLDAYKAADAMAWVLKHNLGCDLVAAITHIGYSPDGTGLSDTQLAQKSEDIDIIIGGHSHTTVNPADAKSKPWRIANAKGDSVLVVQAGKGGQYVGQIDIDLDNLRTAYSLIKVDSRFDDRVDTALQAVLEPYRHGVDSLMNVPVARTAKAVDHNTWGLINFVTDFVLERGRQLAGDVDLAIANRGGIRRGLPAGTVTEGVIRQMLPFNNYIQVIDVKGADLLETFDVMTYTGGNGVSAGVDIAYDPENHRVVSATLDGRPIEAGRTYRVATIDYLANGGDYMSPLTRGTTVARSPSVLNADMLAWLKTGKKKLKTDDRRRMRPVKQ